MSKEQYIDKLRKMGYQIVGNTTYLQTPYGTWISEIVEHPGGFGLVTIKNPLDKAE